MHFYGGPELSQQKQNTHSMITTTTIIKLIVHIKIKSLTAQTNSPLRNETQYIVYGKVRGNHLSVVDEDSGDNVSVNSKPDHPPGRPPGIICLSLRKKQS